MSKAVIAILALPWIAAWSCMRDVGTDPLPEAMEFDPAGRTPEPLFLVVDPKTGRIDFSLAGIDVPADCAAQKAMPQAQCEFYTYLETLDGFPTVAAAKAPASTALDAGSVAAAGNVFVFDASSKIPETDVVVGFDTADNEVVVTPKSGWAVSTWYVLAVRGYGKGVRVKGGGQVVSSSLCWLLKRDESLTCGAKAAAEIDGACQYLDLMTGTPSEAKETLAFLEGARLKLIEIGAWTAVEGPGAMPKDDVAVLWAFQTHSAPVAEIGDSPGMRPKLAGKQEIRLKVKGQLDMTTLVPYVFGEKGSVFLLDLTRLAAGDFTGGLPAFSVGYETGEIVLKASSPYIDGHQYGLLLSNGIKDTKGAGMVASPVTVFLRSRGEIATKEGKSNVTDLTDAEAVQLEAARKDLAPLLDDQLFEALTGLKREDLAYVYAFVYPKP